MKQNFEINNIADITPTPRILRTLGDIPFSTWQCLAELIDNSLDAYKEATIKGKVINSPRIDVHWSNDSVPAKEREIVVEDNFLGMELDTLQKAAKAGYSSNDPIHNLGLFGMGFNIATARLGDETIFQSATPASSEWVGITINFEQLIQNQSFKAPVIREPKKHKMEMGTRIIVRNLKDGIVDELKKKSSIIRHQLEKIYSPILSENKVNVYIQGKKLFPIKHCVWGENRFVMRKGVRVNAIQNIERDLGMTYFDMSKNRYLSDDEVYDIEIETSKNKPIPPNIIQRSRRLKGWLGVQRYADPGDFGIDFVRNGRKILIADKTLFGYKNPDTGNFVSEYPMELGSTIGGRIVGELHVDYLIPTYQKNGFDTTDRSWRLTEEAVRGAGPILPQKRKALDFDGDNESPLGKLINAYRRFEPGTKTLAIRNAVAKEWKELFFKGNFEYQSDEKWYKTAQECDRDKGEGDGGLTPVNTGDKPSDDIDSYIPAVLINVDGVTGIQSGHTPFPNISTNVTPTSVDSPRDYLIQHSEKMASLSGKYAYGKTHEIDVTAWRVKDIPIRVNGKQVPCHLYSDGVEVDFFYDQTHPILSEYPLSEKQILLHALAEKFSLRDVGGVSIQSAFFGLIENHLEDERVRYQSLQERARSILTTIREKLPSLLGHRFQKVKEVIQAVEAEEEELAKRLMEEAPILLDAYQESNEKANQSLAYVGESTIKRIIAEFPEEFMDNKLFSYHYSKLTIGTEQMRQRLRKNSVDRVLLYLSDVILLLQAEKLEKMELLRYANTLYLFERLLQ